jgi:hypothetical protein
LKVINAADGTPLEVPDDQVQGHYQSGKVNLIPGTTLPMWSPQGEIHDVPAEQASEALHMGGRVATEAERHKAAMEAKYGGAGGAAIAGGAGLARGATVGLSDPAAVGVAKALGGKALAEKTRETLSEAKEAHPYVSGAAELAGAVLPTLVAPEAEAGEAAGLLRTGVRTVGAPARALSAIGEAAGSLVPRAAEGAGLGTRMLAAAVKHGATGAAEGALFGAGNEISEATLGDHDLTAEKLMAGLGHGAVMGGLFGAGLGAGGEAAGSAAKSLAGIVSPRAARFAEDQTLRSLMVSSSKKLLASLEALPEGGGQGAARLALDNGDIQAFDTVDTIAPRIEERLNKYGQDLENLRWKADLGGVQGPDVKAVGRRIGTELTGELSKMALPPSGAPKQIDRLVERFEAMVGSPLKAPDGRATIVNLAEFRKSLDNSINYNRAQWGSGAPVDISNDLLKQARGIVEGEIEASLNAGSKGLTGPALAEYKATKLNWRRYKEMNNLVQDAVEKRHANRNLSLTDTGAGMTGALLGGVAHGPVGAVAGAATAIAHKAVRERGNATVAVLADKLATLGAISRTAAKVDGQIDGAIAGFYKKSQQAEGGVKLRARVFDGKRDESPGIGKEYEKAVEHVQAMQSSKLEDAAQRMAVPMRHAPNTMTALANTAQLATSFLASKIPPGHQDPESLTPMLDKPRVTDAERSKFMGYYHAVHGGPKHLLDSMLAGKRPHEDVEVMKAVYPAYFKEIQTKVMASFASPKVKPDYSTRIQLGILFDIPADATLKPDFIHHAQATFAAQAPPAPGKSTPGPTKRAVNTTPTAEASSLPLSSPPEQG